MLIYCFRNRFSIPGVHFLFLPTLFVFLPVSLPTHPGWFDLVLLGESIWYCWVGRYGTAGWVDNAIKRNKFLMEEIELLIRKIE